MVALVLLQVKDSWAENFKCFWNQLELKIVVADLGVKVVIFEH